MGESSENLSAVPRHINLTGERFRRTLPGIPERRKPLPFFPLAWLLFLFCWLVFEVLRVWILTGGFVFNSTKGLDLMLQDHAISVADLNRLKAGMTLDYLGVDPSFGDLLILEVEPNGSVSLNGQRIDLEEPNSWLAGDQSGRETVVFLRPLPGVKYGAFVTVFDQLRYQMALGALEIGAIYFVRCEPDPVAFAEESDLPQLIQRANESTNQVIEAP